jgi:hypothetical protein
MQEVLLNAPSLSRHVMRATLQIPSLQCDLSRGVLRLLLRVLKLPRESKFRQFLRELCWRWEREGGPNSPLQGTWWPCALALLEALDTLQVRPPCGCPFVDTTVRFSVVVRRLLLQVRSTMEEVEDLSAMEAALKYVTSWEDWCVTRAAVDSQTSLHEVRDLLADRSIDGRLPYLRGRRSSHQTYRTHLRGGTYYLLGHEHWRAPCPWCREQGVTLSVPHLLRECPFWYQERTVLQAAVKERAVALGMMLPSQPTVVEDTGKRVAMLWYRLIVGAAVPTSFLATTVFPGEAMGAALRLTPATPPSLEPLRQYLTLMDLSGPFLVKVLRSTQAVFGMAGRARVPLDPAWFVPQPVRLLAGSSGHSGTV